MKPIASVLVLAAIGILGVALAVVGILRWTADGILLVALGLALVITCAVLRGAVYRKITASLPLGSPHAPARIDNAVLVFRSVAAAILLTAIGAIVTGALIPAPWLIVSGTLGMIAASYPLVLAAKLRTRAVGETRELG